jgi:hypothetical protein
VDGISYLQPNPKRELFEVYKGPHSLGIVWRQDVLWHADPYNTASPKLTASTRDAAVLLLMSKLDAG